MYRISFLAIAALMIAGCETGNESARMATAAPTSAELAAYAGAHQYPTTMPTSQHFQVAAVVSPSNVLRIYNFDSRPVRDANVWVNQSFVQHINGIAPHSSVIIRPADLYNSMGQSFATLNAHVDMVQIEMDNRLLTAMGPAAE